MRLSQKMQKLRKQCKSKGISAFAHFIRIAIVLCIILSNLLTSCSIERQLSENDLYLKRVKLTSTDKNATKPYELQNYVKQTTNKKWFGAKIPLKIYTLSKPNSNNWSSRLWRKLGEAPVIYDSLLMIKSENDMLQVMTNAGYIHTKVTTEKYIKNKKITLRYHIEPGTRYTIRNVVRTIDDPQLAIIINGADTTKSLIKSGAPFDINKINEERSRITNLLRNRGYYKFNKDYISFIADTMQGCTTVDLTMRIKLQLENGQSLPQNHTKFRIGTINYYVDASPATTHLDSVIHKGKTIYYSKDLRFNPNLLTSNTSIKSNTLYNDEQRRKTYNNFMRLQAIASSHMRFFQKPGTDTLNCDIYINHTPPLSLNFDLEGTNSAGDLGAAASITYQDKNLFKGSETFSVKLRGAYESITGLDDYTNNSYTEVGGEIKLGFPKFLLPFISHEYSSAHFATSEIAIQYNLQNRPEFNRRVLTGAWRYKWQSRTQKVQHRLDLLEVNYIYMPWISENFKKKYLDEVGKENSILKYNYENLLITKFGYTYSYNSLGAATSNTYGKDAYTFKLNIETSGNILNGLTKAVKGKKNSLGQYTFCGIAYAQYVKSDIDFTKSIRIDHNNSIAMHAALGVAYPYGNSNQLPFEKRYFSGGANSVRGWSVRSLGPGAYKGADKHINFLNQCGDIKIDLAFEYRAYLFWKINGAFFIDGGNIWTIRKYADQPDGEFCFDKFWKQIAISYGLGLRLTLDFFTLRFDGAMKAINPAYETNQDHYPIIHPNLGRDFTFHFAIGLPF